MDIIREMIIFEILHWPFEYHPTSSSALKRKMYNFEIVSLCRNVFCHRYLELIWLRARALHFMEVLNFLKRD